MKGRAGLLESITLEGFLSFGPRASEIPLEPLNVLIGPNGSGKSNLVEALSVLRAVPRDLAPPILEGGGVRSWLWSGPPPASQARIEIAVRAEGFPPAARPSDRSLRYRLVFGAAGESFVVLDERIENGSALPGKDKPYFYFGYENGRPMLNVRGDPSRPHRELRREDIDPTQSILSQRRDPESYPELTALTDVLSKIRIYREWVFGPNAPARVGCGVAARSDYLSETLDNLPIRLSTMKRDPDVKRRLVEEISNLSPGFDDLDIFAEGGRLQLYLTEGPRSVPALRLSDGTLRYLALLAVLLDPDPGPLIVIEEPEIGLHFDMMPKIASLLREAAGRTQLVITTHSDALVDALQDEPSSIVVCEKENGTTHLRRLDASALGAWLESYSLGTLWTRGDIGGTRW